MYVCRTLSFKGADFSIDEVPLEAKMQVCDVHFVHRIALLHLMDMYKWICQLFLNKWTWLNGSLNIFLNIL